MTGRMIGTITRRSRCHGLAPSMIAASLTSAGTSWSALYSRRVKNGTPSQMLATRIVHMARFGSFSHWVGWWMIPTSISTWLIAPPSAWNMNLKMTPVTISGRSQGTMTSERANVLPGNRRLKSKAREKPIRNCAARDPTVNTSVWTIASRLVGSLKTKR